MKRLLLATLWLLLATTAHAQRRKVLPPAPPLAVPVVYCVLLVVDPGYDQRLVLDYGQQPPTNV